MSASSRGRRGCGASAVDRHAGEERVPGRLAAGPLQQRGAGVPVVQVEDVERRAVALERGEGRPAEEREPPRVVGVVVERRRGRRPAGRPPGAAGSRRPRRRRSPTAQRPRRRAGRRSTRAGSATAPSRAPARTGSGAGRRRPGARSSAPASGSRPRARASASTTSARPPVLAQGSHSAARSATRIVMAGIVAPADARRRRRSAARAYRGRLNRFTRPGRCRYHLRLMEPLVQIPVAPGALVPPAAQARGPAAAGLQPVVDLAPRARTLFSRIDAGAWARYRNPIPVLAGNVNWAQLLDEPGVHGRVRGHPPRVRRLHGERRRTTGSSATTATRSTGRSPTSARSTASTSRWASTPAASASSPATT